MQAGILDVYFDWFASPALAILSIVAVEVWHNTSFMMIVFLAGLQAIPQELYETGEVDGASPWQKFWYITLPLLKFTMIVALLIRMIDLKDFRIDLPPDLRRACGEYADGEHVLGWNTLCHATRR
jgi:ABC-type sugar transport system permease subunit